MSLWRLSTQKPEELKENAGEKPVQGHTQQEVLDELYIVECVAVPGRQLQVGATTKRQAELYTHMGVTPPASLQ